jgi:hypothetical protein
VSRGSAAWRMPESADLRDDSRDRYYTHFRAVASVLLQFARDFGVAPPQRLYFRIAFPVRAGNRFGLFSRGTTHEPFAVLASCVPLLLLVQRC